VNVGHRADVPLLNAFERVPLLLAYLLEFGDLKLPKTSAGNAVRHLAVKGINESRAFVACARVGTSWGAFHHFRAMVELLLSSHHLVCDPDKRRERLERFEEYPYLRALMPHLVVEAKRRKNREPTKSELARAALLTPARLKQLDERLPTFRRLWGTKLESVQHWHGTRGIGFLMEELRSTPVKLPFRILDHEWAGEYEHACHATHVSPSAHYLLGSIQRLPILGLQQDPMVFLGGIVSMAEAFIGSVARWDMLVPEARLLNRMRSEIAGYQDVVKKLGVERLGIEERHRAPRTAAPRAKRESERSRRRKGAPR
jgi:hypothetical protein